MTRIERLSIDATRPGMRLAEAVLDEQGHVLVPVGKELDESLLAGLGRRGILTLAVESEIVEDEAQRQRRLDGLQAELDRRFRHAGSGRETRTLYQAVFDFLAERQP